MNFNKCGRCGCFFMSGNSVCPNCEPKDKSEMSLLKNFLIENTEGNTTVDSVSASTGITAKNINRFLAQKDFTEFTGQFAQDGTNININL